MMKLRDAPDLAVETGGGAYSVLLVEVVCDRDQPTAQCRLRPKCAPYQLPEFRWCLSRITSGLSGHADTWSLTSPAGADGQRKTAVCGFSTLPPVSSMARARAIQ